MSVRAPMYAVDHIRDIRLAVRGGRVWNVDGESGFHDVNSGEPHRSRHTVAVELRKRGVPMAEVAGFLGHKLQQFATAEIYARYAPDYRGAAVRAIDDLFREVPPLLAQPLLGFALEDLRAQALSPGAASR